MDGLLSYNVTLESAVIGNSFILITFGGNTFVLNIFGGNIFILNKLEFYIRINHIKYIN